MRLMLDDSRLTEGHKSMALALAGVGLTVVDYVADTVIPDERAADIFGLEPNKAISRDQFHERIHPDDRSLVLAEVDKLIDPAYEDVIEVTHRTIDAAGEIRWVQARKRLYRDPDCPSAKAVSGVAAVLDITARKKAEQAADFLIKELEHRTRNAITVISSIARMIYDAGDPDTFWQRFEPRINALAANSKVGGS